MNYMASQGGGPYPYRAKITNLDRSKSYKYMSVILLEVTISYPRVEVPNSPQSQTPINYYYIQEATKFISFAENELFRKAKEAYPIPTDNIPSLPYEAIMNYIVTLNSHCTLSTYTDQYSYSGGAHGSTKRSSVSWNLNKGTPITLQDLFSHNEEYLTVIVNKLIQTAESQTKIEPIYFPDYHDLMKRSFNPINFYLSPNTITFYFQEYEIAPYAGGIMEFHIPYEELNIPPPSCV